MEHIENPKHCFCHFPMEELKKWADLRYGEKRSTVELLKQAHTDTDKEIISAVALLDVEDKTLLSMMGNVDLPDHHILHCRDNVKKILKI